MIGRLVVNLRTNVAPFAAGLSKARTKLRGFVSSVGGGLASVAGIAIKAGLAIVGAGAAGLGYGVKLAADAEQARVGFTTLLGSAGAAKRVLEDLESFAASTPFELAGLRDSAKQLIGFGVSTADLLPNMKMLGDISAGTGRNLSEFVAIYGKVKATGKVSQETLNQLAERSVPIYQSLASTLGVAQGQVAKLASTGKIGFAELHAALQSTTSGTGMFAGGMKAQSETVTGLFSTMKDNVSFVLQDLGALAIDAFDFKGLLQDGTTFAQTIRGHIASIAPVVKAAGSFMKSTFFAVWAGIKSVFQSVMGVAGVSMQNITRSIVTGFAIAEFVITNWRDVVGLATSQSLLGFVEFGNTVSHLFTAVIPGVFAWFVGNWRDLFTSGLDFTLTVFKNLATNVRNIMGQLWDYIASGGTKSLALSWTPLTEGFVATLKELPNIPKRAIGPLEATLQNQISELSGKLGTGLNDMVNERLKVLDVIPEATQDLADIAPPAASETGGGSGSGGAAKFAGALKAGTADSFKAIFASQFGNKKTEEKQTANNTKATAENTAALVGQLAGVQTIAVVNQLGVGA